VFSACFGNAEKSVVNGRAESERYDDEERLQWPLLKSLKHFCTCRTRLSLRRSVC